MIFWRIGPSTGIFRPSSSITRCTFSLVRPRKKSVAAAAAGTPMMRYHHFTKMPDTKIMISVSRGSFGTSVLKVAASCGTSTVMSTITTAMITTNTIEG